MATQTPEQASVYQLTIEQTSVQKSAHEIADLFCRTPCQPYDQCSSSPAKYRSPSTSGNCCMRTAKYGKRMPFAPAERPWSIETGSGIWLPLSSQGHSPISFLLRPEERGLGRWRLEVASGFPYLAKPLPATSFIPASDVTGFHVWPWSMGTGNGIWLSLSSKAPASTKLHLLMHPDLRGLGGWRLEVAPGFPYLAKLPPPCQLHSLLHAPQ